VLKSYRGRRKPELQLDIEGIGWTMNGGACRDILLVIYHSHGKWPFIVSFPIKDGDFPYSSFLYVYQRVLLVIMHGLLENPPLTDDFPIRSVPWIVQGFPDFHVGFPKGRSNTEG